MYRRILILITLLFTIPACAPEPTRIVLIPTLMELPTATANATETETSTPTPAETAEPTLTAIVPLSTTPTETVPPLDLPLDPALATAQAQITVLYVTIAAMASPTPTNTASPTPQIPLVQTDPQWFIVRQPTSLRECPDRACAEIVFLTADSRMMVDAFVYGEDVDMGNDLWYRVTGYPQIGYVHSAAAIPLFPEPPAAATSAQATTFPTVPAVVNPGLCPGEGARCTQLSTCEQAYACLAAGNRSLDRDGDGIPCEALCEPGN